MRVRENVHLDEWKRMCEKPVIGQEGHRLRFEGGPAHPKGYAPNWVTSQGVNVALLHLAHSAAVCHEFRGCSDSGCGPVAKGSRRRVFWLVAKKVTA